jgi:hypothetical protein
LREIPGHWLDPASVDVPATPGLGVRIQGRSEAPPHTQLIPCPVCGEPLSLLVTYGRSAYLRFERFDQIALEFCVACASETDGSADGNGFFPKLLLASDPVPAPALPAPIDFSATPTQEPISETEFRAWKKGKLRAKLGGRQISIQPPLESGCRRCSEALLFVASVDESWASEVLNFGGGFGYLFVCRSECSPDSTLFYWDCC